MSIYRTHQETMDDIHQAPKPGTIDYCEWLIKRRGIDDFKIGTDSGWDAGSRRLEVQVQNMTLDQMRCIPALVEELEAGKPARHKLRFCLFHWGK